MFNYLALLMQLINLITHAVLLFTLRGGGGGGGGPKIEFEVQLILHQILMQILNM